MIVFKNPNDPPQPRGGVYRWYVETTRGGELTLYVGEAGSRRPKSPRLPSTLARGVSEAQRATLSSDKGMSLDTDFIVGTALKIYSDADYKCVWEHLEDNPKEEKTQCKKYVPILQEPSTADIKEMFRLRGKGPWQNKDTRKWSKEIEDKAESDLRKQMEYEAAKLNLPLPK